MSFSILITEPAENDIKETALYIAYELKNPAAANKLIDIAAEKINALADFPYSYTVCDADPVLKAYNIRIIPVKNYLIFYRINENDKIISIIRFLYKKRNWINILKNNE